MSLACRLTERHVHRPERVIAIAGGHIGEPITARACGNRFWRTRKGAARTSRAERASAPCWGSRGGRDEMEAGQNLAARLVYAGFARAVIADAARGEIYGVVR